MASTVFELLGRIAVDNTNANKGIDDTTDKAGKAKDIIGGAFTKVGEVAVAAGKVIATGMAAGAAAIGSLVKQSVEAYSEYEQLVGGVETLFKDSASIVQEYADNAYLSAGLSANEYMNTVTSFSASLLQGLGGDTEAAAKIADLAITDMSDNANKMGSDMSAIQNAYQGFAKQNYTLLDNLKLGYGGTQAEMARLINDSGVLGDTVEVTAKTVNEVSFDKIIEAIHVVQEDMGIAGATAAEAATTIEGSTKAMKAAWQNLVVGMSNENADLELLVENFVDSVGTMAENILPRVEIALDGAGKLIDKLFPIIIDKIPSIISTYLPKFLNSGASILQNLIDGISKNQSTLEETAINILWQFIFAITDMLPQIVELGLNLLLTLAEGIVENIDEMIVPASKMVEKIVEILTNPDSLSRLVNAAVEILVTVAIGIVDNLILLVDAAISIIVQLVDTLTEEENLDKLIDAALTILEKISTAIIDNLPELINAAIELVTKLMEYILDEENITKVVETSVSLLTELATGIVENLDILTEAAAEIVAEMINTICNPRTWWNAGKAIVSGLAGGFDEGWQGFWNNDTRNALIRGLTATTGSFAPYLNVGLRLAGVYNNNDEETFNPELPYYEAMKANADGSHASGLANVPYDGYIAELHKGEMVIPAETSKFLRSSGVSVGNSEIKELLEQIVGSLQDGGFSLNINKREFARMVKAVT